MSNKYDLQLPDNEAWLNELLGKTPETKELGPDEQAVSAAGLTHPDDLEFEKIMQEVLAEQDAEAEPEVKTEAECEIPQASPVEDMGATIAFSPEELQMEVAEQIAEPEEPELEEPEEMIEQEQEQEKLTGWKKAKAITKKYGLTQMIATIAWLLAVIVVGIVLGRMLWVGAADLLAFGKEPKEVMITIEDSDTLADIANKLADAGMVDRPSLFKMFAQLTGKDAQIGTGSFTFTSDRVYDYNALIKEMTNYGPARDEIEIMFPEGYNCAQIFALLEEKGVCSVEELEAYAATGELADYWFLDGVSRGHKYCLEGYLAPDTYRFYTNDEPKRILEKFLDEFDDRFNDDLRQKYMNLNHILSQKMAANGYSSEYIASHQLSVHEVVIMASIIEKETANNLESYTIASVFYNRLTNLGSYPYLGSDATIVYAEKYYNKGEIQDAEDRKNNPYNTYTHIGLTPGPIANPGLNSLGAALSPKDTDYYYFIYDKSIGEHRFSKTLADHERWAAQLGLS